VFDPDILALAVTALRTRTAARREADALTAGFDWHSDPITRATPITDGYRNTQNVRRFLRSE